MELKLVIADDMKGYTSSGLEVTNFVIVYNKRDLEEGILSRNHFKASFSHQIYGEKELVFGYKDLQICIYYLHNTAQIYLEVQYSKLFRSNRSDLIPDDIKQMISAWYPGEVCTDRRKFLHMLAREDHKKIYGKRHVSFVSSNKNNVRVKFEVRLCTNTEPGFVDFHRRFESLIVWFIDQANAINVEDDNWMIIYLYEEVGVFSPVRTPVGFCTVYKFYQFEAGIRARISQFFILPTHHRLGLGRKFYRIVFDLLKKIPNLVDVTVEKPCDVFTRLRDRQDCLLAMHLNCLKNIDITRYDPNIAKLIRASLRVSKCQSLKLYDVFYLLNVHNPEIYKRFQTTIKKRYDNFYKRQHSRYLLHLNFENTWKSIADVDVERYSKKKLKHYIKTLKELIKFINGMMDVVIE